MSLLDVAPTLLGFLGLNPPLAWQGEDRSGWLLGTIPHIRPDLEAGEPLDLRDGWAVVRHLDGAMVRTLDWRWEVSLAAGGGKTGRLVAENTPLSSRVSLADRHPEVAGALDRLLRERLRTLQADFSSMPLSGTMKRFLRQAGYLTEEGGGR